MHLPSDHFLGTPGGLQSARWILFLHISTYGAEASAPTSEGRGNLTLSFKTVSMGTRKQWENEAASRSANMVFVLCIFSIPGVPGDAYMVSE